MIFVPGRDGPALAVMAETDVIRRPDQRVRVFVSSVLGELAAERAAVRSRLSDAAFRDAEAWGGTAGSRRAVEYALRPDDRHPGRPDPRMT
jgi:hypothetical protein